MTSLHVSPCTSPRCVANMRHAQRLHAAPEFQVFLVLTWFSKSLVNAQRVNTPWDFVYPLKKIERSHLVGARRIV